MYIYIYVYGYIECTVLFNIGDIGFHDYKPFFLATFHHTFPAGDPRLHAGLLAAGVTEARLFRAGPWFKRGGR